MKTSELIVPVIDHDIIAMGYTRGKHMQLICNQAGMNKLPKPLRIKNGEGWHELDGSISKSFYVWIQATKANAVSLVLGGWITYSDAENLLDGAVNENE